MKKEIKSSEIIPWTCHICKIQFDTRNGGICSRCNNVTCLNHLFEMNKKKENSKIVICDNCLTADEKEKYKRSKIK
jgi:hypothetical protein